MVYRKASNVKGFLGDNLSLKKTTIFILMLEVGQFIVCGLKALLTV